MRPHVELIHEQDSVWHRAELPHARGEAVERRLSADEETGAASLRVDARSEVTWPPGRHAAELELYVLEGELAVGERRLGPGGYIHAPARALVPGLRLSAGARVLLFREGDGPGFEPEPERAESEPERHARGAARAEPAPHESPGSGLTLVDASALPWTEVRTPGPPAGLTIKPLHRDPGGARVTRLIRALPGWRDPRLEHHLIFEEAFTLAGRATYNFGELTPGTYFFRPPRIKHGDFTAAAPDGCTWLIRSGGEIVNYYTEGAGVTVHGRPLNYVPEREGPTLAGVPVRSRSAGEWDGSGR
jgi:hypothetical protein